MPLASVIHFVPAEKSSGSERSRVVILSLSKGASSLGLATAHKVNNSRSADFGITVCLKSFALSLAIFLTMSAKPAEVVARNCDNVPPPQIEIQISKSEVQEAYDLTAQDIQHLAESTGKRPSWPGLGAFSSNIAYSAEISENAVKERDGSYCATPAYVQIGIALKNRVIHLAQELKQKPCLETVQKERLLKLAHADEQALDEFPIETEMRSLLGQLRPSRAKSELAAKAQVTTSVREKIQVLLDKVQDYAAELNRKINSPEDIERLRSEVEADPNCR